MLSRLLWCILFIFCLPVALVALVLYPLIWLSFLSPRMMSQVSVVIMLPIRLLNTQIRMSKRGALPRLHTSSF
jgi:hypothetical protein